MKNKLLEGNFMEERLRKYFRYMERVYGEEIAIKTALSESSIRASIANFSEDFYDYQDFEIDVELFKLSILTDRPEDTALKYANTLIGEGRIEQLTIDMATNPILKLALIENYVRHMYTSTENLYNKAKQTPKYRIIERDLENLREYKEKHEAPVRKKETKKEEKTLVKKYQPEQIKETVKEPKRRRKVTNN